MLHLLTMSEFLTRINLQRVKNFNDIKVFIEVKVYNNDKTLIPPKNFNHQRRTLISNEKH